MQPAAFDSAERMQSRFQTCPAPDHDRLKIFAAETPAPAPDHNHTHPKADNAPAALAPASFREEDHTSPLLPKNMPNTSAKTGSLNLDRRAM
jgi:hypothetical protein